MNSLKALESTMNNSDAGDDVDFNNILESIELVQESLAELNQLSDIDELKKDFETSIGEEQLLMAVLNSKTQQLSMLENRLKCIKADYLRSRKQCLSSYEIAVEIFKGLIKFHSKASHEIRQKHASLGFDIEYQCHNDLVTAKIRRADEWIELTLNEYMKFELINMYPKPDRFADLQMLFDSTQNIHGLMSVCKWQQ